MLEYAFIFDILSNRHAMKILTRQLGTTNYIDTFEAMKAFTAKRNNETPDEIWLTQHNPVFTQGQSGKAEHLLRTPDIPIVQSDRGGQITYHGHGQIILYALIDIKRAKIGVRDMVNLLENSVTETLATLDITANANPTAPGVYVEGKKIASLGLRIRKGCTYHGLALNVDMDLSPFQLINPCGYQGLKMTQIFDFTNKFSLECIGNALANNMITIAPTIMRKKISV